jgi:hypothetical protein
MEVDRGAAWQWSLPISCDAVNIGKPLLQKLREAGLEIESGRDVNFVPDEVFGIDRLTGFERQQIVAQFTAQKAAAAAASSFGDDSECRESPVGRGEDE